MTSWYDETIHSGFRSGFIADRIIFESQTDFQKLVIFENRVFGRVMMLDGITQTTEADEFIYHESLSHLPIFAHGSVKNVLIIGGGDGGTAEEVLKHRNIENVTLVEIDEMVVEVAQKYLPSICGKAFDDKRLNLIIENGVSFVKNYTGYFFDLIIVDSTDPVGPGKKLFSKDFYSNCKNCLSKGGIIVTQNGVPFLQGTELSHSMNYFKKLFLDSTCFIADIPTYVGGSMAFGWGTDAIKLRDTSESIISSRIDKACIDLMYYNSSIHHAAFKLPNYIKSLVNN